MTMTDWTVVAGGLAAVLWVNWYFFLAQRSPARPSQPDGDGEATGAERAPDAARSTEQ